MVGRGGKVRRPAVGRGASYAERPELSESGRVAGASDFATTSQCIAIEEMQIARAEGEPDRLRFAGRKTDASNPRSAMTGRVTDAPACGVRRSSVDSTRGRVRARWHADTVDVSGELKGVLVHERSLVHTLQEDCVDG